MSTLTSSGAIYLTPADCFLRAVDSEIRRFNGASHNSQLILRLGPGLDASAFAKLIGEAASRQPILKAPIGRRLGLGKPVYRISSARRMSPPRLTTHDCRTPRPDGDAADLPLFYERINERFDIRNGDLLRFDIVQYEGGAAGTDLGMTWIHMLFDGSGSENFLRWLEVCSRDPNRFDQLPSDEFGESDPSLPRQPRKTFRQRGQQAQSWVAHLDGFAANPPRSLGGGVSHVRQALRHRVRRFGVEESRRIVSEATRQAGVLTPMLFYLAATTRAHHAVFRARGEDPGSYVVPLPVNIRPRGAESAIFRTHVSLIWFQIRVDQVEDFSVLIASLKEQRRDAIKSGMVESSRAAMEFAQRAPARVYSHMARRTFGGELCSFFFAYTGELLEGMDTLLGSEIESAYHVAPVPASPGSCAAMSLRNGRLSVTHAYQSELFSQDELHLFDDQLARDLLGNG